MDTASDEFDLRKILPSAKATSSKPAFVNGLSSNFWASLNSFFAISSQTSFTAEPLDAAVQEPPSTGDFGNLESPSSNVTFSMGKPSVPAAIWVMIV